MKRNIIFLLFCLVIPSTSLAQYVVHRERDNTNQQESGSNLRRYGNWTDISALTSHFRSCKIKVENECLVFRVQTSAKEYSFLEDDPEQVRQLLWCIVNKAETINGEYRIDSYLLDVIPRLSDEFVTAVFDVPSGQTKKGQRDESIENGSQQKVDPFQNLDTEVQGSENRSTDNADYTTNEDPFKTAYGRFSMPDRELQQLSSNENQVQGNESLLESKMEFFEGWLEYIVIILFVLLIIKGLFKALFSSSKKSNNDRNYEDGSAWFHDHGKDI